MNEDQIERALSALSKQKPHASSRLIGDMVKTVGLLARERLQRNDKTNGTVRSEAQRSAVPPEKTHEKTL
ncbi:MAG: hypothetical protein IKQ91_08585 [Oscillospiraceae bacterium]|nr:hypothetical protein [Oscillospiraceae bacterium]